MASNLAEKLRERRRRQFVGRSAELARLHEGLGEVDSWCVAFLFGPGGVGKSSLLREFAEQCAEREIGTVWVDGNLVQPTPEEFSSAVVANASTRNEDELLDALQAKRHVIAIDNFEKLASIEDWLRDTFLPRLPGGTWVVIAGRAGPGTAWRADPGWKQLLLILPIRNLNEGECRVYLESSAVPKDQHEAVVGFTHGHPLALSLVADLFVQQDSFSFEPQFAPDVVGQLVERFVETVPSADHAAALEVCALARETSESLLAHAVPRANAGELFGWLRGLSFVEASATGLRPHEMARDALALDLRWRKLDRYAAIHESVRRFYSARLEESRDEAQQTILLDYIFLHRDNPMVRPFFEFDAGVHGFVDALAPNDTPHLVDMVRKHEGDESALLAAHWLKAQPENVLVVRGDRRQKNQRPPIGFVLKLSLERIQAYEEQKDPAVAKALGFLGSRQLSEGEAATMFRFWMADDTYQEVSPIQSLLFVQIVRHYFSTKALAYTFLPCAKPDFWLPVLTYAELDRLTECDFQVGTHAYGVYGHDWRELPTKQWLDLLASKELPFAAPPSDEAVPASLLDESAFEAAVHDALKACLSPARVESNPLLHCRMVEQRLQGQRDVEERMDILRSLFAQAANLLSTTPKDKKLFRAVRACYLEPVGSQETAAEKLDVSIASLRRHLKEGVERLTAILWRWENSDS